MKKLHLLCVFMCFGVLSAIGQTAYNPFTQNIHFAPEPSPLGFECGSTQSVVFTQGFTTASDATQWQTDPLTVTICLGGFVFNGPASSVVTGTYATNFDWAFDVSNPNCIIGTQNQTLVGTGTNPIFPNPASSGTIQLSIKVPQNSPVSTVLSVNVTLQVPPYMATFNSTPDDNESTQTQTFCGCYFLTDPGVITGNQSFCVSGDPVAFSSQAPGSGGSGGVIVYQWQELISGVWTDISGATAITYDAPPTSTARSYRRNSKRSLCGNWLNSDTLNITINSLPVVNAGPDQTLNCNTTSTIIGTSSVSGNSYSWSPATGLDATNIAQPTASPLLSTTYTLTVTGANGCSAIDTVTVNVNTTPPVADGGPDKNLTCSVSSASIGTAAIVGNTYAWSPASGLNATNIAQPIANPALTTTYTVTVTGANGCSSTGSVTVNVNLAPPVANAGPSKNLNCSNPSASIGTAAISGNTYSWSPAIGLSSTNSAEAVASPLLNTLYTVTVTGANGCTASSTVLVNVDINPPVANAGADKNLNCFITSTTIGSTAIAGNTYSWSPSTGLSSTTVAQPIASPSANTVYTVTVTGSNGCTATSTVSVNVNNTPPTANAGPDKIICELTETTIGTPAIPGYTYLWSPAAGLTPNNIAEPTAAPAITSTYTLTVTGENGCNSYDTVVVTVNICLVNISGHVYNDTNALTNLKVDGPGINNPDSTQLFANLLDSTGHVIRSVAIDSNGFYEFTDVPVNQKYSMVLSLIAGTAGQLSPSTDLPGTWVNTGEDCCDQNGSDGGVDGKIVFNVGTSNVINIDFGIKDPAATGLPLTLKDFVVIDYNCSGLLSWTTSEEENTAYTEIYRKENAQHAFLKIGTVQNAGNSLTEKMYSFIDKDVNPQQSYEYQLKFIDIDGQFTKSDIKTLNLNCNNANTGIQIFPNPASRELSIVYMSNEADVEMQFDVLDIAGRKILSTTKMLNNGGNLIVLDLNSIARGTYVLHYHDFGGTVNGSVKFVKQ